MQTQFRHEGKTAAELKRIQWDKVPGFNPALMIPHLDMLSPDGIGKAVTGRFGCDQAFIVVYNYTYILDQLPELSESIPSSLVAGTPEYLEALREAFKEYQSNQKIETWGDVVKTLRGRLKMKRIELAERVGVSDSTIGSWETGYCFNPASLKNVASLLALIETIDEKLLDKAISIVVAAYQSKLEACLTRSVIYPHCELKH
ncbi:helix-turn-helix transcriptional regulator [Phormidium nigroviride]